MQELLVKKIPDGVTFFASDVSVENNELFVTVNYRRHNKHKWFITLMPLEEYLQLREEGEDYLIRISNEEA